MNRLKRLVRAIKDYYIIKNSGLFDAHYYLSNNRDVRYADINPLKHYVKYGGLEGRNPSGEFDAKNYLEVNTDVLRAGVSPLVHYVLHGKREKRYSLPSLENVVSSSLRNLEHNYNSLHEIKNKFKVSVVVPNYNHEKYLRRRIESILNQTYQNIEIILLDDCSTDGSRALLKEYEQNYPSKIKTIFNQENAGNVFKQWRKGINSCCGELVWVCESDDYCEKDFLEKLVKHFENPAVQIAFGRIQFCDADGKFFSGLDQYRNNAEKGIWNESKVRPAKSWFCNAFGVHNVIANVGGCLFRKQELNSEVWETAQTYKVLGDWYLYAHIAMGGLIAYEPTAVSYFRQHESNTSGTSFKTAKYYEEHSSFMKALKSVWNIPDPTVEKFFKQIQTQYHHFNCESTLGEIKRYVDLDELKKAQSRKKHILIGMLAFHPGGGELFPINLANALLAEGYTVSLFVLKMNDINQEMYSLVDKRIPIFDAKFVENYGVKRFLEDAGIDLINSHMVSVDVFFLKRNQVNIPYIPTLHGSYEACGVGQDVVSEISKRVMHWIYTADRNLSRLAFLNLEGTEFTKLPNAMPIDEAPFPRTKEELGIHVSDVVFTLVARGIKRKGWRAAIEAFIKLSERHKNIHLLLCGDGEETKQQLNKYQKHPKITFLGYQSKIHGLYRISDCAIVPTRFEGESYPLCIIQAFQVGLPVIATDIGEIKSMLTSPEGDVAGILLPNERDTESYIQSLEVAMEKMIEESTRSKFANESKIIAKNFSMDSLAKRYSKVFDNKTLYIHIGHGKTGTTSIQKMLIGQMETLKDEGFYIPRTGIMYGMAHHALANLDEVEFSENTKCLYQMLRNEIDSCAHNRVIISSELFSSVSSSFVDNMYDSLGGYDVKIIFYFRDQISLIESAYLQAVKVGHSSLTNVEGFFNSYKDRFDFEEKLRPWANAFGRDNIICRLFDKHNHQGDVCSDFLGLIGCNKRGFYDNSYLNESVPPIFVRFLLVLNSLGLDSNVHRSIVNEVILLNPFVSSNSCSKSVYEMERIIELALVDLPCNHMVCSELTKLKSLVLNLGLMQNQSDKLYEELQLISYIISNIKKYHGHSRGGQDLRSTIFQFYKSKNINFSSRYLSESEADVFLFKNSN